MPTLTEKHVKVQAAIGVRAMSDLAKLWAVFNVADVDGTWALVERPIMLLTESRRLQSAAVADAYYKALRSAEGVPTPLPDLLPPAEAWRLSAANSYRVTGPVWTKAAIEAGEQNVKAVALKRVQGALTRHVMDGGRDEISRYVRAERIRYRRIVSGRACDFCRMLGSRGAVYYEATVGFRSHDNCTCTSEPVFRR